jgi:hypothetical protein
MPFPVGVVQGHEWTWAHIPLKHGRITILPTPKFKIAMRSHPDHLFDSTGSDAQDL